MKVSVLSPAVAVAAGFVPPTPELFPDGAYAVAAPDCLVFYATFEAAKAFAFTYLDAFPGITISFL